jgi:hypothetical protein
VAERQQKENGNSGAGADEVGADDSAEKTAPKYSSLDQTINEMNKGGKGSHVGSTLDEACDLMWRMANQSLFANLLQEIWKFVIEGYEELGVSIVNSDANFILDFENQRLTAECVFVVSAAASEDSSTVELAVIQVLVTINCCFGGTFSCGHALALLVLWACLSFLVTFWLLYCLHRAPYVRPCSQARCRRVLVLPT